MVIVIATYLIFALVGAAVSVIIWLGLDSVVRGYQLWERRNQDREDEAGR